MTKRRDNSPAKSERGATQLEYTTLAISVVYCCIATIGTTGFAQNISRPMLRSANQICRAIGDEAEGFSNDTGGGTDGVVVDPDSDCFVAHTDPSQPLPGTIPRNRQR